jgi:hypothetical protein
MPKFLKNGKQAVYEVPAGPKTVIMQDEITHTIAFPVCADETCICHTLEQERLRAEFEASKPRRRRSVTLVGKSIPTQTTGEYDAPLNSNRGFSLLR